MKNREAKNEIIKFRTDRDQKERYQKRAESLDKTISAYIITLIEDDIKRAEASK